MQTKVKGYEHLQKEMKISGHRKCRRATREDEPGDEEEIFTAPEGKSNEHQGEKREGRGRKTGAVREAQHLILLACPKLNLSPPLSMTFFYPGSPFTPWLGH